MASGTDASASAVFAAAVRMRADAEELPDKLIALRRDIDDGFASGVPVPLDIDDIITEVRAEHAEYTRP